MEGSIIHTPSPEEIELENRRSHLHALESELTQHELDLATFKAELRALELLYLRKVGVLLTQLDLLDARINEILARFDPENLAAKRKAQRARKQADKIGQEVGAAQAMPEESTHFTPSEKLKNLYREAAKLIHPDLAFNGKDHDLRTVWMMEVNAAYQAGDEARLRAILEEWNNSPESVQGVDYNAELERINRKIIQVEKRIQSIKKEAEHLRSTFAFSLQKRIEEARQEGHDLLEEMAYKVQMRISKKQTLLDDLMKRVPLAIL